MAKNQVHGNNVTVIKVFVISYLSILFAVETVAEQNTSKKLTSHFHVGFFMISSST